MKMSLQISKRSSLFTAMRFAQVSFLIFLASCGTSRADLEMQARSAISKDIKNVTGKSIDGLTAGLGSFFMDMAISKKEQDSLLLRPILPYVNDEIKRKTDQELMQLSKDGKERFKLISSILIKNKDAIAESIGQKYQAAKAIVDLVIKFIDENKDMVNKLGS